MTQQFDENRMKLEAELRCLTSALSFSTEIGDYKIIKCYEAKLQNKEMPYDIDELIQERQKARKRINEIKNQLKEMD